MSVDFFDRPEGRRFVSRTMPDLIQSMTRLSKALEKANRLRLDSLCIGETDEHAQRIVQEAAREELGDEDGPQLDDPPEPANDLVSNGEGGLDLASRIRCRFGVGESQDGVDRVGGSGGTLQSCPRKEKEP